MVHNFFIGEVGCLNWTSSQLDINKSLLLLLNVILKLLCELLAQLDLRLKLCSQLLFRCDLCSLRTEKLPYDHWRSEDKAINSGGGRGSCQSCLSTLLLQSWLEWNSGGLFILVGVHLVWVIWLLLIYKHVLKLLQCHLSVAQLVLKQLILLALLIKLASLTIILLAQMVEVDLKFGNSLP